jgi:hypothetical protein
MFWGESLLYMCFRRAGMFEKFLIRPKNSYPTEEMIFTGIIVLFHYKSHFSFLATKQLLVSHFVTQLIALYFVYDAFVYCGILGPNAPAFPSLYKVLSLPG